MNPLKPDYEPVYRRAFGHYQRGEMEQAIELLERLEAGGQGSTETRELLEDIRLQQKLITHSVDFRAAPAKRRSIWPKVGIGFAAALLLVGAAALLWVRPWQQPPVSAAITEAAPTALPPASAVPPTATPAVATATPVPPTAAPAPPMVTPPPAGSPSGQVVVRLPAGQSSIVRGPRNIAIILDASGSMRAQVNGQPKMNIARDAVREAIEGLPDTTQLELRTYGNQRTQDCSDLSLIRPLGVHERAPLLEELAGITPAVEGMTPIAATLEALKADLAGAEGYTAVLLVSDGAESCGGDPALAAQQLAEVNPQLRIHVIGFDIGDEVASERLRAIAQIGGGSYFDARNSDDLSSALQEAVQLSYRVLSEAGDVVSSGQVGGAPVSLPPGRYRLILDSEESVEAQADVSPSGLTVFELAPDGSKLAAALP